MLFFFLSGMTGLIYEVLWTRRLSLIFGHTVLAVSTVVACYMTGLGLGSLIAGRFADRRVAERKGQFLAIYGFLEIAIGLWAFLSVPLLNVVEQAYVSLSTQGATGLPLRLACLVGAMIVLVPPTAAMGATLPVMSRLLVLERADVGRLLAKLYGLNTLGAFTGATLAGFALLPWLGSFRTLAATACVNLVIGSLAVRIGRNSDSLSIETSDQMRSDQPTAAATKPAYSTWVVPLAFGLAGVSSMGFQIAWTRGLALSLGSSTYAFTTILTTFLAGLGLGSLFYPRLMRGKEPSLATLAWLQTGIGIAGATTIPLIGILPIVFLFVMQKFDLFHAGLPAVLSAEVAMAGLLLMAPTLLMGLAFPLANQLYTRDLSGLGRSVGEIYGANTLGCILGSVLAGFVGVPYLGAQWTLKTAAIINLLIGLSLFWLARSKSSHLPKLLTLVAIGAVVAVPNWDPGKMTGGVAFNANSGTTSGSDSLLFHQPAFYRDGLSSTVSVGVLGPDNIYLKVNGKADASTGKGDVQTQFLLGYIPALIHHDPKEIMLIGLGGGQTAKALMNVPGTEHLDIAELEPAVVEADAYFKAYNDNVLADPRVHVHETDGRTFVLGSSRTYDVIVSEPSNPWIAGIGNLYTRDFYQTCSQRLKADGLMCQWFNLYATSVQDTSLVVQTFFSVFPEGSAWMSSYGDLILIGSKQEVALDLDRVQAVYEASPKIQKDFFEIGLFNPVSLLGHFLSSREKMMETNPSADFNTDDRPILEFSAPFNLYRPSQMGTIVEALFANTETPEAMEPLNVDKMLELGQGWVNIQRVEELYELLPNTNSSTSALLVGELALRLEDPEARLRKAREAFGLALSLDPQNTVAAALAAALELEQKQYAIASLLYRKALESPPPGSLESLTLGLGQSLLQQGLWEEAESALKPLLEAQPQNSRVNTLWGELLLGRGSPEEALTYFDRATEVNQTAILGYWGKARALTALERNSDAEQAYLKLLSLTPSDHRALLNLGVLYAQQGRNKEAKQLFEKVLAVFPYDPKARQYLQLLENQ